MQLLVEKSSTLLHNKDISITSFTIQFVLSHRAYFDVVSEVHPLFTGFHKLVNILSGIEPLALFLHPSRMLPTILSTKEINRSEFDKLKETELYQDLAEKNKLTSEEEAVLRDYLQNLDPTNKFNLDDFEVPDYGPITYADKQKVLGGNPVSGYFGPWVGMIIYSVFLDDTVTLLHPDSTIDERLLAGFFLIPTPAKFAKPLLKHMDDVAGGVKGTSKAISDLDKMKSLIKNGKIK